MKVLAGVETQNYAKFKKQQDHNIENARRRAVAHYNQYFNTEQNNAKMNRQENVLVVIFRANGCKGCIENLQKLLGILSRDRESCQMKNKRNC